MRDAPMASVVLKEGCVAVRGHFMWRERYVVVSTGELLVRRSKTGAIKAKVDLLDPNVRVLFNESHSQLTISSHGHDTVLDCRTPRARDEWLGAVYSAKGPGETDCESDVVLSTLDEQDQTSTSSGVDASEQDSNDDDSEELACNATLLAFQDLRSSILRLSIVMTPSEDTTVQRPSLLTQQVLHDDARRLRLQNVVRFIQTVPHGGKAVLLHLDVLRSMGVQLEAILASIGERQRDRSRQPSLSASAAGLQRLNVSTFVRYILFHPVYAKHADAASDAIGDLIDKYFPHCRLRRFSHDIDHLGSGSSSHSFDAELGIQCKSDGSARSSLGTLAKEPSAPRATGVQVHPASMTKVEILMHSKRKRHSFPNILLPLPIVSSNRALHDGAATAPPADPAPRPREEQLQQNDSELFSDDVLVESLRSLLWRHSCPAVAEQMSLFHQRQLSAVRLWELLQSPRAAVRGLTDHFNRLVTYLVWSVLVEDTPKDRAEVIESIITIARTASAPPLSNFHLVMACIGCLGDTPLMPSRIPLTWKKVQTKYKRHLQELRALCDHAGGFEALRRRQLAESARGCCIPFIGVIGVALERLRSLPYTGDDQVSVNLERIDKQYLSLTPVENAVLRPYKLSDVDEIQRLLTTLDVSFASHRLLQLRSQQLLAMETAMTTASARGLGLYRGRLSQSTGDGSTDESPPVLAFRQVCSVLVMTSSMEERLRIYVDAILSDNRQHAARVVHKLWVDFRQSVSTTTCHLAVRDVRSCVAAVTHGILSLKDSDLQQLSMPEYDASMARRRFLHQHAPPHLYSVLFFMQQALDNAELQPVQQEALDLLDEAVASLSAPPSKRVSVTTAAPLVTAASVPVLRKSLETRSSLPAAEQSRGVSYAYLLFSLLMLRLAHRGANKDVARENIISFFAAVVPTELAHKLLPINAAVVYAVVSSARGRAALGQWVGAIAGVAQLLAVGYFAQNHHQNVSAKQLIRLALSHAGLPVDRVASVGDLSLSQWLGVLLPVPQRMALALAYPGVQMIKTVTYAHVGENRTTRLRMDVFKHNTNTPSDAPILLYVHGGAWVVGTRERPPLPLIYQVASRGWVVCSVDYRLSPKVAFPEHLIDVKRAIAFLRQHAKRLFDADPAFIAVAGESAGGHLASLMALTPTDKSLQPGFEHVDTSVRACVDTYGVHDVKDRHGLYYHKDKGPGFLRFMELIVMQRRLNESDHDYELASPISWLMEDKLAHVKPSTQVVPPFLLTHGTHDTLVPFDDSRIFFEKLQQYRQRTRQQVGGVDDIFLELPGAHHAFNYLMSPRSLAFGDAVCLFLDHVYKRTKHLPLSGAADTAAVSNSKDDKAIAELAVEVAAAASAAASAGVSSRL
ncbi:hypothetical protein P43SY_002079 [Pythium insidiosum]|uniref:Ras-GEF domain-containing protein n=1 Tax=Pythium insidiosum TaxID=114742 RepID=A0AAD5M866_PYTIN|nr:hypothetical protein P43SY_002079 [Pythium insidiosum]